MSQPADQATPAPGQEPNLHLLDCERCEEPRYHLFELVAAYPLCFWMVFHCGECGREVNGWLDRPYTPRWSPAPAQEEIE